jgi:hypothetical protein
MRKNLVIMTLVGVSAWSYSFLAVVRPQLAAVPPASGQTHTAHKTISPDAIQWTPVQSRPGSEIAVLSGNPAQEGAPFVLRIKLRNGIKVPPHWHPTDEHLTVMSGIFHIGTGEKLDQAAAQALPAGSYMMMPKEMRHFAWAEGETIIQLHGIGPFKTIWVNPADDPSKKTGATTN